MKKITKIALILTLSSLVIFAFTGCAGITATATQETVQAAADAQGFTTFYATENGNLNLSLTVNISATATLVFTQFDTVADARTRFTQHEQTINAYSTHSRSIRSSVGANEFWRVNAGGSFYALYRTDAAIMFAVGQVGDREAIQDFINSIVRV